jgi:hypothetical protein
MKNAILAAERTDLTKGARLLWIYLGSVQGRKKVVQFKMRSLAAALGATPNSVMNWLRELEGKNMLSCETAFEKGTRRPVGTDCSVHESSVWR